MEVRDLVRYGNKNWKASVILILAFSNQYHLMLRKVIFRVLWDAPDVIAAHETN